MNKKLMIGLVVLVLVGLGSYFVWAGSGSENNKPEPGVKGQGFYTEQESLTIAEQWIQEESPTYTYDGFDLAVKETRGLDMVDCEDCYEFDFSFKSRHGGFGDREGKMVTQAITPHLMTVRVEHGEVTMALTDNEFNEMTGEVRQGGQGVDRLQPREVKLFYYNQEADKDSQGNIECSSNAVLPLDRVISGQEPIRETMELLLQGELRPTEEDQGFSTEFPNPEFRIKDMQLQDGVLTLTFSEVPGFTSGGSCRVTLLRAQVEKTALQFPEVEEVKIRPVSIFQP
ncbi:MAG TPA: GerMN domain-containing protein [Patescibacteria group bacterium]|nr:GerMN domain-containing protein [Patescibacteria group bacterium]